MRPLPPAELRPIPDKFPQLTRIDSGRYLRVSGSLRPLIAEFPGMPRVSRDSASPRGNFTDSSGDRVLSFPECLAPANGWVGPTAGGLTHSPRGAAPQRRREFLQAGLLAAGGLSLETLLRARAAAGTPRSDKGVILLYLHGGPSQLETYDLKPLAPVEYRSVFEPIASRVPGMDLCELFPRQAALADKIALIRSVHHTMSSHTDGGIEVLTGKTPTRPDPTSQSKSEHPDLGAVASRVLGLHPAGLPRYVAIPQSLYMIRPAYLGLQHGPLATGDPNAPQFKPPGLTLNAPAGLAERAELVRQFDRLRGELDQRGSFEGVSAFREQALEMLTSPRVAQAFDLSQEPEAVRDDYGRTHWGQSCLLARRLCEAGVSVVTLYIDAAGSGPEHTNWDDHIMNAGRPGHFAQFMRLRLPALDQALGALIADIDRRGSDSNLLVAAFGEFGRTPRLSHNANGTGRDHWPEAQSVLLAGGGLKTGQVIGATNSRGEYPSQRPLTPRDVLATLYRHLGIDRQLTFPDFSGRPIPLLGEASPIAELL